MYNFLAHLILNHRIKFLVIIFAITGLMAWQATKIQLSYDFVRPLPMTDPAMVTYEKFKSLFGEDGTVLVIGIQDSNLFEYQKFIDYCKLTSYLKNVDGIKEVLSIANVYDIKRNDSLSKFDIRPVMQKTPANQAEVDSFKNKVFRLPFYENILYNKKTHAHLIMATFDKAKLNSKSRISIVNEIKSLATEFGQKHNIHVHFSGMPYIRAEYMVIVSHEMKLFLLLAILVTSLIVLWTFKSLRVVAYSLVILSIGVVFSLGTLTLFGFKISILTGLIPAIITVIGLPNIVFIVNKYQMELLEHGDKQIALKHCISKVGLSNFLANITTAIGFGVFIFTHSILLVEFGIVAAINVMITYTVALIIVPIILSYMPPPKLRHTKHLTNKYINKILESINHIVLHKRRAVYISISLITIVAAIGIFRIQLVGYLVDDLPQKSPIYADLRFFESNFRGVLPFEISVDTKKENGVFADNAEVMRKIRKFQNFMDKYPEFSKPLSIVEATKFAYQAYRDGDPKFYQLPDIFELKKISDYTGDFKGKENKFSAFLDSTKRYTRISYQMADVGSIKMKKLVAEINHAADSIFPAKKYQIELTGSSLVFLKGNDFLFHHLFVTLAIAIILILLLGIVLFRSVAIIVLSKLPCLIPLIIAAGIMGYFNINFKPTTIIIYAIAFGITSDGTIYILTEYWSQLRSSKRKRKEGSLEHLEITQTINEVGFSMIYTSIILFCGFAIFIFSSFGGTMALGIMMSLAIVVSLVTNLILLPSLLISIERHKAFRFNR